MNQRMAQCGQLLEKEFKGRWFKCPKMRFSMGRDLNAVRNIAKWVFFPALKGEAFSCDEKLRT